MTGIEFVTVLRARSPNLVFAGPKATCQKTYDLPRFSSQESVFLLLPISGHAFIIPFALAPFWSFSPCLLFHTKPSSTSTVLEHLWLPLGSTEIICCNLERDYLSQDLQHLLVRKWHGDFKTLATFLFCLNITNPECPPKLRKDTSFLPSMGMLIFHSQTQCTGSFPLHPG